jgi:hypothetical protein
MVEMLVFLVLHLLIGILEYTGVCCLKLLRSSSDFSRRG